MKLEQLYDDVKVVVVDPGNSVPVVCGVSGWDRDERRECVYLDPEQFQPGQVKEARDPSNVVRDSHSYEVECIHKEDAGDYIVGIFDVHGFHTTDDMNPEDWENRKLWVVVKMKEAVIESKREALKRHLVGLIKTITV